MKNSTLPHGKLNSAIYKVSMRRTTPLVLIMLLLALAMGAKANPVDMRRAREVGAKFISMNTGYRAILNSDLQLVTTYHTSNNDAAFHVFNTPKGFVIVSADDCATPILGYSDEGHFDVFNIPIQMQEYLQGFVEQIQYGIDNHLVADETIAHQWELVQTTGRITEQRATTSVAPLLNDNWGQGCYYNDLCPEDADGPCGHVVTGCAATSFAQIMHYWGYPNVGTGSHTYTPSGYPTQTANFGATTYQWANMPNELTSSSSTQQINAVATLMWHCGVAINMNYGPSGSGASPSMVYSSFLDYFNYSSDQSFVYKSDYTNTGWLDLMKNSLNMGRPIHYSGWNSDGGSGHSFVCDGYDSNDMLHFNWGWYGSCNDYFAVDALNPSGYDFSYYNCAIINIHPNCASGTTYQVTATASPSYGGTVYGSGSYDCGSGCVLTAVPAEGYMFCSWTENGMAISSEPTYSFTVMGDRNLEANFVEVSGGSCTLEFVFNDSYGDGWNGNALTVSYSTGCNSYEELTLNGGSSVTLTRNVVDGSHIVLGWITGGWPEECSFTISYLDGDIIYEGSNLSNSFTYEFDVNCNGISPTYYDITATANPTQGGTVNGAGSFTYGEVCTLTATAAIGYTFIDWTKNGVMVSSSDTYSFVVTESADFEANFEINNLTPDNYIEIGDGGSTTNNYLPSYSFFNYTLSQQIYTADEIGRSGMITGISFFNGGTEKTRNYDLYLVTTEKSAFESNNDWIPVTEADLVFSDSVTMIAGDWTTITFNTPFQYDGINNLAVIVDDNTGNWSSGMACRVFNADGSQAIRVYSDNINYDPYDPTNYSGTLMSVKNQLRLVLGSNELTVYDGTTTNGYVPVYGYFADAYLKCEYIMPATELSEMANSSISAMTYYLSSPATADWGNANFQVFMKEVSSTTISSYQGMDGATIVYEGPLDGTQAEMHITFTTPFHYSGGNLLIGIYNTVRGSYKSVYYYGQTVSNSSIQGYSFSSLDDVPVNQRNFLPKTTFTYTNAGPSNLIVIPNPIDMGYRPNGAWMHPFEVNILNTGIPTIINSITTSNPFFQIESIDNDLPNSLGYYHDINLNLTTGTGISEVNAVLDINYGDNQVSQVNLSAIAYEPVCPDVWELAQTVTTFPYTVTLNKNIIPLYDNYRLPPTYIEDGADAVYKLVFTEDTYLNASITNGENGKVALYPEDFMGLGGPDLGNSYTRPQLEGNNAQFEAMIGDETSTTYSAYMPFYTLYNYSISEALFTAAELAEAGVTTAPMGSLSWEAIDVTTTQSQENISIWMANVPDTEVGATSMLASGMTLVYTGSIPTVPPMGWNEFVFNQGSFAWDGASNMLILVQRNNGQWNGHVYWRSHNPGFYGVGYKYQDNTPYDAATQTYDLTRSNTNRPNTLFKSVGRRTLPMLSTSTSYPGVNTNTSLNRDGWMYYDNGIYATSVGAGGDIYWGTMFSASMIAGNSLAKVALYENSNNIGTITLNVYSGGDTAPGTQIYSQNITPVGGDAFHEITLASPVTIDPSQNLWIVFHQSGDIYPANACEGSSYPNNRWVSLDGTTWYDLADAGLPGYEWMIRAYIEDNIGNSNINNLTVTPGTYYLVASSTSDEFTIEINTDEVPCPEFATNPHPADAATEVGNAVNLTWNLDSRATEYRLMFGTTYYCEETLVDWTDTLSERYRVYGLNNNTNYFWRIDQRNDGCPEGVIGQVWGFTTHLNVPRNLYADDFIHQGDNLMLSWDDPNDRSFLYYNIYQNYELIGSTYNTYYSISDLPYNINPGYYFNVTAVYDEGESNFSNTRLVRVTGEGIVEGYVYEQDGVTPIQGARVEFNGSGQVGGSYSYYYYTDESGHYSFNMIAGTYSGTATHSGYQNAQYGSFTITYNEMTSDINFVMDELFNPVTEVVAKYYPDAENPNSPYVKVIWSDNVLGWHTYIESEFDNAYRSNVGNPSWGYEYPVEIVSQFAGWNLTKVAVFSDAMYNAVGGNFTCNVYVGGSTPAAGILASTITVDVPVGTNNWEEFDLTIPVNITGLDPIWVIWTMNSYGTSLGYPAGCASHSSQYGDWWNNGQDGWQHMESVTWTMKNYFSNLEGRSVALTYNDTGIIPSVSGNTCYNNIVDSFNNSGVPVSAINPNPERIPLKVTEVDRSFQYYRVYRTDVYNNGPYTPDNTELIADEVADLLLIDVSWPEVEMGTYKYGVSCVYAGNRESQITWDETNQQQSSAIVLEGNNRDAIFSDDFESGMDNWTIIDADGDGYNWILSSTAMGTGYGHNGSNDMVYSQSYNNSVGALNPDNYLITPQLPLGGTFSFWACAQDANYAAEHFGLAVSTSGNTNPNDFTMVQEWNMTAKAGNRFIKGEGMRNDDRGDFRDQGNWYYYEVNLSDYAGQNGYIAFRHFNCTDQFYLNIDDVEYTNTLQVARESQITWSNPISKDMILGEGEVNISVTLNSGDSPEGTMVRFINQNSNEQQYFPVADIILDATGYYAWDSFRKGDYRVFVIKDGYGTISDLVSIWDATDLSYMMTETIPSVVDLYVSSTGWAMWNFESYGVGDTFEIDFENGMPAGWTTIDADGDGYNWMLGTEAMGSGYGHNGSNDLILSMSYNNNVGALNPDNYLVSPVVNLAVGSTFSFWACAQDNAWASEHFGVAVSDNGTSNWIMVQEWTMTTKGEGGKAGHSRNGGNRTQGTWYQYTVDLSAYVGMRYIAIRHFNCTDWFYLDIDDIELTFDRNGDRHFEYNQMVLTDMQDNVLFSGNTENSFIQLPVDNLTEGQTYHCKVASVYSTGMTEWAEVDWVYQACDNYEGASELFATTTEEGNLISWTYPIVEGDGNRDEWIFFNGFVTDAGAMSNGGDASWVKGSQSTFGPGCQQANGNRIGDSFTLTAATMITEIEVYGYQTGSSTTSTFTGLYAQIYNGNPMNGGQVIWGDEDTNIMTATAFTNCYRGSDGDSTGTTRPIMSVTASGLNIELEAGTYYLVYQLNGTGSSGPWGVPHAEPGIGNTGNGIQWLGSNNGWQNLLDSGTNEPYGVSFRLSNGNTTIGAMVYRDNELLGFTSDNSFLDEGETNVHEYTIRVVYGGSAICPDNNMYYSMSCPQSTSNEEENHWNANIHQYPYNMSVTGIIQINGVEQAVPTLEIGAFCGNECRGSQRLIYFPQVDRYLVFLTLYGDAGDMMSFRLYDHSVGEELDLFCSSTISFVPDGFMGTPFDPYVFGFNTTVEQVSNFSQGYNWWSTYIEQNGINGLEILENSLGSNGITIRSQASGFNDYYAGYGWYGSLSSINNESSYRVITSAPCTVTMIGGAAVPSQHPITLSQGWTWIGYVPLTTMSVDAAMAGVDAVQGDKLKSQQGYADYYPGYGWFGSLTTIEPGMGLMYYSINGNPVPFTYPDNNRDGELKANLTSENNHWKPNIYAYPDNMTVMAVVELDGVEITSDNYELATFANGECRGSVKLVYAEPLHRYVAFLTISGKDAAELNFRLYNTETNEEYYDAEESLNFVANAIVGEATDLYVVHFRGMTGMNELANKVQVYPNPVNKGERFNIGLNAERKAPVRVEIINELGVVVSVVTLTQAPANIVAPSTAGVYTLKISCEEDICYRKMVVR